jgi:hypothetical protein
MAQISLNSTNKIKFSLDVITGIATLALLSPPLTGIPIHEWLGLAAVIPLLVHLLINWQWIVATTRRFFGKLPGQTRINYILNGLLFILMTAEGFSGVMISKVVLPSVGLSASNAYIYRYLHSLLADSLLIVFGLHLAMNWKWVLGILKKNVIDPLHGRRALIDNTPLAAPSSVKAE